MTITPVSQTTESLELVPARMLNEYVYCPRLCYMEWVQGEFAHNADTLDGRLQHRRVDQTSGNLPVAGTVNDEFEKIHARSVLLSDETLGAIARIDLVETKGRQVTPIDYKRGKTPDVPGHVYDPERVQICVQGLLLRANGYQCDGGIIYYVGSKRRIAVPFDAELIQRTQALLSEVRSMAAQGEIPPPLEDSPKCPRCSLVGICLPDEVTFLRGGRYIIKPDDVRRLVTVRDDALPMYVQTQGATVGKSGETLTVKLRRETIATARMLNVSSLSIFGNVQITAQATRELLDRGLPVCHFSYGGWLKGITASMSHKNVELRIAQFRAAADLSFSLSISQEIVKAKIRNCRVFLRRNNSSVPQAVLNELERLARSASGADSLQTLLGIEGAAARVYFSHFGDMLQKENSTFDFRTRNRRPPRDPVNAVLSFLYSMLMRQVMVSAMSVGFDPYLGVYHQPKYGRPALALDLAEEFRPLIADSVTLRLFNNGELKEKDFIQRVGEVSLTQEGRRNVIKAFESRLDATVTHPLFGYAVSYRRVLEIQARLLGRHLLYELKIYPAFRTR